MVNETAKSETVGMFQIEEVISRPKRNEKKKNVILTIITVIIATLAVTAEITLLTVNHRAHLGNCNNTSCPFLKVENDEYFYTGNNTLCKYLKQFNLSTNKKVSVCAYNGAVRINFRRFIDKKATIQGIYLNVQEWRTLLRLWGKIQIDIGLAGSHI